MDLTMSELLPSIRLIADSAMATLIWLVQLVIYPAFHSIDRTVFTQWHHRYMNTISFVVIPLMFLQAACIILQWIGGESALPLAVSAISIGLAWTTTFTLSVPCHQSLQQQGYDHATVSRLVRTNWIRTAAWSTAWLSALTGLAA
jgi:hypothetical protein